MEINERFDAVEGDYAKFDLVEAKRSQRPDLHALLLLDELFPNPGRDIIRSAAHSEIWLDVEGEKLNDLTDPQILELARCGVRYDSENDYLIMFV
jgi:hypothetical protein